jgi:hypothetical protein
MALSGYQHLHSAKVAEQKAGIWPVGIALCKGG